MAGVCGVTVKTLHRLVGGTVEALEFPVPEKADFIGVPLKDLKFKPGILVAGIVRRNGRIVIPSGNDMLEPKDDVIVVTTNKYFHEIREIFE
jgi:trk system potassium uptake protein TrkA